MSSALQWWGYKHVNGTYQVKRYFDALDLQEARESEFVLEVYGPFDADTREEAVEQCRKAAA